MKKRIIGYSLICCLILPFLLSYMFLHYQKKQVRKELKRQLIAGIDREELVLLKFTVEETKTKLNWKHSKEFEFDGEMYDIVETRIESDSVFYWCWWDHEETRLNKELNKLIALALGKDAQNNRHRQGLFHIFKSLYFNLTYSAQSFLAKGEPVIFRYLDSKLSMNFPPPTPPPKAG